MEALTFSELRKIQKEEARQEDLSELNHKFLLRVGDYLDRKKDVSEDREYRNAKRVFYKIISLREEKIVKNAKLAVQTDVEASTLNLLPREKELFRTLKDTFQEHRDSIDDEINGDIDIDMDEEDEGLDLEEPEDEESESYEEIKITGHVPEFMGTDLESYGPFDEGEEVEVPEENAEILVNRGNAERV